jgi:hypothetical protein
VSRQAQRFIGRGVRRRFSWLALAIVLIVATASPSAATGAMIVTTPPWRDHEQSVRTALQNAVEAADLRFAGVKGVMRFPERVLHLLVGLNADQYAAEMRGRMAWRALAAGAALCPECPRDTFVRG